MNSIAHALIMAFTVSSQGIIGYSNTASIMRLAQQAGAGASTSPDDLTQQERLAQAVWILQLLNEVCTQEQVDALACRYGYGSDAFCEGAVRIVKGGLLDGIKASDTIKGMMLQYIYGTRGQNKTQKAEAIALLVDLTGKTSRSVFRWIRKIEGLVDDYGNIGEERIELALRCKGMIECAA